MFKSKTLFVVGAGASCEVGLPTGAELRPLIAHHLDIRFDDGWNQNSGSRKISAALKESLSRKGDQRPDINSFLEAAWTIRDASLQAISIDNYIEAHQDNPKIELCGKLAIVQSILESEKGSKLFIDGSRRSDLQHGALADTWYLKFLQLLTENVPRTSTKSLFENVSFVTFNYDRCIEHFLVRAVRSYYAIAEQEAQELASGAAIYHPYGMVGRLSWQNQGGVQFGAEIGAQKLLDISEQIKTFAERIEEVSTLTLIRGLVEQAETIIFLGFAFHETNMDLLKPATPSAAKRVFWTTRGISLSDQEVVREDILSMLQKKSQHVNLASRPDLTCSQLFSEYWRALSR